MINMQGIDKPAQTWETAVLVPVAQNVGGGIASALLIAIIAYAWNRANGLPTDIESVSVWSTIIGAIVSTGWTIVRFFGDELGIIKAAYTAGQRSRDDEIIKLNRQINAMQARAAGSEAKAAGAASTQEKLGKMKADYENAKILLKVALGGGSIARDSNGHGITKHPWGRASRMLVKAKVIEEGSNKLIVMNRQQASEHLSAHFTEQAHLASGDVDFQPSWW